VIHIFVSAFSDLYVKQVQTAPYITDVHTFYTTIKCCNTLAYVRFQIFRASSMKMRVFWDIMPCSLVGVHGHFRGAYCLHHQGDDSHLQSCIPYSYIWMLHICCAFAPCAVSVLTAAFPSQWAVARDTTAPSYSEVHWSTCSVCLTLLTEFTGSAWNAGLSNYTGCSTIWLRVHSCGSVRSISWLTSSKLASWQLHNYTLLGLMIFQQGI
jgi:hypothetical protein